MRVGVNCCFQVKHAGGIRQYVARLINRVVSDPNDEYVLFHLRENVEPLDELLVPDWRRHAVELTSVGEIGRWFGELDVYFCPSGMLYPRPLPLPSVVTLVDVQEAYYPHFFTFLDRWSRFYHYAASARMANRVITISEFSKRCIATFHEIPPARIDVAYLAPDQEEPPGTQVDIGALPRDLPQRFLLYPANFWLHKNHERLLQALAIARDQYGVTVPCVLTGAEVPHGYKPAAGIARFGLNDQVRLLGYQSAAAIGALYRHATALVFPSLLEGFGLPVVEAMAAGCPVVCAKSASLPEVAGDAAVYFDAEEPADMARTLLAVWTNDRLRADLACQGQIRAKRFSVDTMAQVHRQAFELARQDFALHGPKPDSWVRDLLTSGWRSIRPTRQLSR